MPGSVDDGIERQKLANNLTIAGVVGITATGIVMIVLSEKHGEAAERVMTAVLPLFGSWIATVLAYYLPRRISGQLQAAYLPWWPRDAIAISPGSPLQRG